MPREWRTSTSSHFLLALNCDPICFFKNFKQSLSLEIFNNSMTKGSKGADQLVVMSALVSAWVVKKVYCLATFVETNINLVRGESLCNLPFWMSIFKGNACTLNYYLFIYILSRTSSISRFISCPANCSIVLLPVPSATVHNDGL